MSDMLLNVSELQRTLAAFAVQRDWVRVHTPKNLALALMVEAAELGEVMQWRDDAAPLTRVEREALAEELADVLIYGARLAHVADIDLARAVWAKVERNTERFPVTIEKRADSVFGEG
jgi:dCTP diphosphatase